MSAGLFGVSAGLVGLVTIKQPQRGAMVLEPPIDVEAQVIEEEETTSGSLFQQFQDASTELMGNQTGLYVIAASSFKKMADYAVSLFQPLFFAANFPDYSSEFIFANAFYYLVPTTIGAVTGGWLSDRYEKKSYWSKAIICGSANLIAAPFCAKALLDQENGFWLSIGLVSLQWFFDSMWVAPSIVML